MLTVIGLLKTKNLTRPEQGDAPMWAALGEQYLQAWVAGVRRYVPEPKRIVVMTDSPSLVPAEIDCVPLLTDAPAFWQKMQMFHESVSDGRCLYVDLDNVFCGDLTELCSLTIWPHTPSPIMMMDDRNVPRLPNGSVMLFEASQCRDLWAEYQKAPEWHHRHYVRVDEDYSRAYDQAFIAQWVRRVIGEEVPLFQDRLPRDYCLNAHSELPQCEDYAGVRLIFGCGLKAKPHRIVHPLIAEHWAA